jgi:hypothetical protein
MSLFSTSHVSAAGAGAHVEPAWSRSDDAMGEFRECWDQMIDRLPDLGSVLGLFPAVAGWPNTAPPAQAPWPLHRHLLGLVCAARARLTVELECHGPIELLWFDDRLGQPGFALGLLPDSNHFAWDALLMKLPHTLANMPPSAFDCAAQRHIDRVWRSSQDWQASALRFTTWRDRNGTRLGSEPVAALSTPGHAHAALLARRVDARLLGPACG